MPITTERRNIEELRAAGFTETQAIVLAAKLEATAQAVSEDLKAFITAELDRRFAALLGELNKRFGEIDKRFGEIDKRFGEIDKRFGEMEVRMAQMEARFEHSLRLQLATILSAFVAVTTLAVAILKLF